MAHRDHRPERRYKNFIHNAKNRNLIVDLTYAEYKEITEGAACTFCGQDIISRGHGLDRIDNNQGYIISNVVPCCLYCNQLRSHLLTATETKKIVDFLKILRQTDDVWSNQRKQKQERKQRRKEDMAFKSISNSGVEFKKLTDLKVGEAVTGYLLGIEKSTKLENAQNMFMKIGDAKVGYGVVGNIKYLIADGKLTIGANTRITRLENIKIKGKQSSNFNVEQDTDDVYLTPGVNTLASATASSTTISEKIAAMKAGGGTSAVPSSK